MRIQYSYLLFMHIQIHPCYQPETRLPEHKATGYAFTNIRSKWGDLESNPPMRFASNWWMPNMSVVNSLNIIGSDMLCLFFVTYDIYPKDWGCMKLPMSSHKRAADVGFGSGFGVQTTRILPVVLPRIFTIARAHTENGTEDNEAQSGSPLGISWN